MLFKNSQLKNKGLVLVLSFSLLTFLAGCNDKHEDKNKESVTAPKTVASPNSPKIEVVINDNSHEIKVKEKNIDANQSKSYYYDYNIKSAYDENSEPANGEASVRAKPRNATDANLHIRSPYEEVQVSMIVNKLSKKYIVKCSACHNDYANGVIGPSLLGKDADYIFNKIAQFKSGEKTNVLMSDLIKMMSDEEIKELANEIYQFNIAIKDMRK